MWFSRKNCKNIRLALSLWNWRPQFGESSIRHWLITARGRSTREDNVFTLFVCPRVGGRRWYPSQDQDRVPPALPSTHNQDQDYDRAPPPHPLARTGTGYSLPPARTRLGYPPPTRIRTGYSLPYRPPGQKMSQTAWADLDGMRDTRPRPKISSFSCSFPGKLAK